MENRYGRSQGVSATLLVAVSVLALLVSATAGHAGVIFVNGNAKGSGGEGASWSGAYQTIQQGLNAAGPGDEIWVAAGVYRGTIALRSGVALYGGFLGVETRRSARLWARNPTILHGGYGGSVVTAGPDVRKRAVLDGFVLRDGEAESGGGISCRYANVLISHNKFVANMAENGGAIYCDGGEVTLVNNVIQDNRATRGGALRQDSGTVLMINNTIVGNNAAEGGAVHLWSGTLNAINNIIAYNRSGIIHEESASLGLHRNLIYGNGAVDYKGFNDPAQWEVNMQVDPRLTNWADGTCHLANGSPCIDAGDDNMVNTLDVDLNGSSRRWGSGVDIGAYEYRLQDEPHGWRPTREVKPGPISNR